MGRATSGSSAVRHDSQGGRSSERATRSRAGSAAHLCNALDPRRGDRRVVGVQRGETAVGSACVDAAAKASGRRARSAALCERLSRPFRKFAYAGGAPGSPISRAPSTGRTRASAAIPCVSFWKAVLVFPCRRAAAHLVLEHWLRRSAPVTHQDQGSAAVRPALPLAASAAPENPLFSRLIPRLEMTGLRYRPFDRPSISPFVQRHSMIGQTCSAACVSSTGSGFTATGSVTDSSSGRSLCESL